MLSKVQGRVIRRLLLAPVYGFSASLQVMKSYLAKNLYSIELINKNVNRRILGMVYSPGVGAVCEAIEADKKVADVTTLRARSIAIVTDGSMLDCSGPGMAPTMDWLVAQIKFFSGLDAFPFIVSQDLDLA
jgi:hypothetical protein